MINKNVLRIQLPEIGKIKIGMKGKEGTSRGGKKFQMPTKLDHFLVTGLDKDGSNNFVKDEVIHNLLGDDQPKEIPIMLMYNDIEANFQTRLACYNGKNVWCSGDGESAQQATMVDNQLNYTVRNKVSCPCHRLDMEHKGRDRCKPSGRLSCLIQGAEVVGGCWVLRTTSWNTIQSILGSLNFIKSITNGELAGIPLMLRLSPKQVDTPQGAMTAQIVSILYKGEITQLRKLALDNATERVAAGINMQQVEQKLLSTLTEDDITPTDSDYVDEFQPEQHGDDVPEIEATENTETVETADDKKDKAEEKKKAEVKKIADDKKAEAKKKADAKKAAAEELAKKNADDGEFDFEAGTSAPGVENTATQEEPTNQEEYIEEDPDPADEEVPPEIVEPIDNFGFGDD